jgi:predicted nucleic acid-binding Zn ribbon protein
MPIFEYICAICSTKNNEEYVFCLSAGYPPQKNPNCPNCGNGKTVRKWNPAAVHFRGNGFYSSDNKKGDDLEV